MTTERFKNEVLPVKDKLYRYALSIVHDPELAKDLVQEVLLKLWHGRDRLSEIRNIEAWSVRLTRNLAYDKQKSFSNRGVSLDQSHLKISGGTFPDKSAEVSDLMVAVHSIVKGLPETQQEIFRLRDIMGYSNAEIAESLELDPNQVKVYLFRARKKIKEVLTKRMNYGLEKSTMAIG